MAFMRSLTPPPAPHRSGREPVPLLWRVEGIVAHDAEAPDTGWGAASEDRRGWRLCMSPCALVLVGTRRRGGRRRALSPCPLLASAGGEKTALSGCRQPAGNRVSGCSERGT